MNAEITIQGLDELLGNLARTPEQLLTRVGGALYRQAEAVMADAKERYVPVDLGTLRDSGTVSPPEFVNGGVQVALGFGGAAAAYAAVVHEDLTAQHPNGGGAKYLERPLLERSQSLLAAMAEDIRAELGS